SRLRAGARSEARPRSQSALVDRRAFAPAHGSRDLDAQPGAHGARRARLHRSRAALCEVSRAKYLLDERGVNDNCTLQQQTTEPQRTPRGTEDEHFKGGFRARYRLEAPLEGRSLQFSVRSVPRWYAVAAALAVRLPQDLMPEIQPRRV